jgi:hypothetical protein
LGTELNQVVALAVTLPDSGRVEVADTLRPHAIALNGRGDSIAASIVWSVFDTAALRLLDSTSGVLVGRAAGVTAVQARAGALRSNPIPVSVVPFADSLRPVGATRDTVVVSARDSLSDSLVTRIFAASGLAGRRVAYTAAVFPPGTTTFTFEPRDTVRIDGNGFAVARLRFTGGTVPDSVVVTAKSRRGDGTPIPGSPVTFVVEFRP